MTGLDVATAFDAAAKVTISGTSGTIDGIVDVPGTHLKRSAGGIAQSTDGDFWVTDNACTPSTLTRIHPAATFSASAVDPFIIPTSCAYPTFLMALADGTLWVPIWDYPIVEQVIPGTYPAAPVQRMYSVPSPQGIYAQTWDVTLGPDGDLYFTDEEANGYANVSSANVIKMAY